MDNDFVLAPTPSPSGAGGDWRETSTEKHSTQLRIGIGHLKVSVRLESEAVEVVRSSKSWLRFVSES